MVVMDVVGERAGRPDGTGPDGVLYALRALCPRVGPVCCAGACPVVRGDARRREPPDVADLRFPDLEFEAVVVHRLARRSVRAVADARSGRPAPRVWRFLADAPPAPPPRLALAGAATLLGYDLPLAVVGACTVLGRPPGVRERDAHDRIAATLGDCLRELIRCVDDPDRRPAALRLAGAGDGAWRRAEHLWRLRGRPTAAEDERDTLDRLMHAEAARLLGGC